PTPGTPHRTSRESPRSEVLGVLAGRVARAGDERAAAALADQERLAALVAVLPVGLGLLLLGELDVLGELRGPLALGVRGAAQERAAPGELDPHGAAAALALHVD